MACLGTFEIAERHLCACRLQMDHAEAAGHAARDALLGGERGPLRLQRLLSSVLRPAGKGSPAGRAWARR